jgi:hypothetical protein
MCTGIHVFMAIRWNMEHHCPGIGRNGRVHCTWMDILWFVWCPSSGSSLPLIICIHVRSGPIYWGGGIYLAKKIIRWWYFTCKKPENIICDGILYVNMFHYIKISYFTCTFFTKFIYNEYIGPCFFFARCSTIFASELPECPSHTLDTDAS